MYDGTFLQRKCQIGIAAIDPVATTTTTTLTTLQISSDYNTVATPLMFATYANNVVLLLRVDLVPPSVPMM